MRAILIDSAQRHVRGIEVDLNKIKDAFMGVKSVVPIEVATVTVDRMLVIFYDRNAVLKHPADFFYFEGVSGPIFGKGVLVGHRQGIGPESTQLRSSEVAPLVGFHKERGKV